MSLTFQNVQAAAGRLRGNVLLTPCTYARCAKRVAKLHCRIAGCCRVCPNAKGSVQHGFILVDDMGLADGACFGHYAFKKRPARLRGCLRGGVSR